MSTVPAKFNYSVDLGIHSLGGAVTFAVLYVLFFAFFIRKSITHPTYVYYVLTLFCAIRITAFTIRSVLAGSKTAGDNLGVVVADEILSSVGYFGLLYSSYTLVLNRTLLSDLRPADHPILRFTQEKRAFRLLLMLGVILGIVASSRTTSSGLSNSSETRALRIASVTIFLFLTLVQALQTAILATASISEQSEYHTRGKDSLGIRYGNYILLLISVMLVIRECFSAATVTNAAKQNNEHFWYPLIALPEIIVVIFYTTPGLVPKRAELQAHSDTKPEYTTPSTA